MPQARNRVFPKHPKKERLGRNNDKTKAIYETIGAQRRRTTEEQYVRNYTKLSAIGAHFWIYIFDSFTKSQTLVNKTGDGQDSAS